MEAVLLELKALREEVAELRHMARPEPEPVRPETLRHPFVTMGERSSIDAGVTIMATSPDGRLFAADLSFTTTPKLLGP